MRRLATVPTFAVLPISVIAVALGVTAGCRAARPPGERPPELPKASQKVTSPVIAVRKIAFESGQTLGYLKVHEDIDAKRNKPVQVYWVHDSYFKVLGFYTDTGETYQVLKDGGFRSLGLHDVDDAKRILLRTPRDVKIQLIAMDDPRTLESDAETLAQAKAAADAAKAKAAAPEGGAPADGGASNGGEAKPEEAKPN